MLSASSRTWPTGDDWVLQPKWDGFRLNPRLLRLMRSADRPTQAMHRLAQLGHSVVRAGRDPRPA
jgi:hypothetical protein